MAKYTVLGAKGYDFKDDNGVRKTGATLYYIDERLDQGLLKGYIPFNISVNLDILSKISSFPAVCDIEFKRVPNAKGRAIEVFSSLDYIAPAEITTQ
jgi:hypothetical protein